MSNELQSVLKGDDGWAHLNKLYEAAIDEVKDHEKFIVRMIYVIATFFLILIAVVGKIDQQIEALGLKVSNPKPVAYTLIVVIAASYYLLISRWFQQRYLIFLTTRAFALLYPEISDERILVAFHPSHLMKAERIVNRFLEPGWGIVATNGGLLFFVLGLAATPVFLVMAFLWCLFQVGGGGWMWGSLLLGLVFVGQSIAIAFYSRRASL